MKNREKTETMRLVLDHYGLAMPLSPEIQKRMAKDYNHIYNKVVKRTSQMTAFMAVMTWIFFMLKKIGIPVYVAKVAASAVLVVSIGTGSYVAVNKIVRKPAVPTTKYTVMIRPFVSRSLDKKAGFACAESLRRSLDEKYGQGFSQLASGPGIGETRWTVFGTVEKIKSSTFMIMKLIDSRTSRTVFMAEEKCASPDQCNSAAARMAKKFPSLRNK